MAIKTPTDQRVVQSGTIQPDVSGQITAENAPQPRQESRVTTLIPTEDAAAAAVARAATDIRRSTLVVVGVAALAAATLFAAGFARPHIERLFHRIVAKSQEISIPIVIPVIIADVVRDVMAERRMVSATSNGRRSVR